MRVLFTFVGGRGHFDPLAPIARAAEAAGHAVAFGCAPAMVSAVSAAGFTAFAMGEAALTEPVGSPSRLPLLPVDRAREERDLRERFVRRAGRARVPLTVSLCESWQADVLVCDETDFGAHIAAECLGLPCAIVLVIAAGGFVGPDSVGDALGELRAAHGLPPDPKLEARTRCLVLAPFPPSYRDPEDPLPASAYAYRPGVIDAAPEPAPAWASVLPGAPRVYFTLGTVFNLESGDLFERVLAGLSGLSVNVLATIGDGIEPRVLERGAAHIRIERHAPQASVLPHCDLVVSHGGSGSVIGALSHGLPAVLIPIGADQPLNAARCAALGVARVLEAGDVTPERVRAAVRAVLDAPAYRRCAEALRDDIRALPDVTSAVLQLERFAEESTPDGQPS